MRSIYGGDSEGGVDVRGGSSYGPPPVVDPADYHNFRVALIDCVFDHVTAAVIFESQASSPLYAGNVFSHVVAADEVLTLYDKGDSHVYDCVFDHCTVGYTVVRGYYEAYGFVGVRMSHCNSSNSLVTAMYEMEDCVFEVRVFVCNSVRIVCTSDGFDVVVLAYV